MGGLFDLGATLPLIAIQFILLMIILNVILYNPVLAVIEERKEYILTNLGKAAELLGKANNITTQYEAALKIVRAEAQLNRKNLALNNLEDSVESLCKDINIRLSI